jgi:hypothetical protein
MDQSVQQQAADDDDDGSEADAIILRELDEDEKRRVDSLIQIWLRKGEILLACKEKCGHDNWLPWLKAHSSYNKVTAQRYMRIFKKRDRIPDLSKASPVTHFSDVLAPEINGTTGPATPATKPDPVDQEAALENDTEDVFDTVEAKLKEAAQIAFKGKITEWFFVERARKNYQTLEESEDAATS